MKTILQYVVKLQLNSAQQIRMMKGSIVWCCSLPSEGRFPAVMKKATKEYENTIQAFKAKKVGCRFNQREGGAAMRMGSKC
eukprot:3800667-Karenia_brevis.AAC.1